MDRIRGDRGFTLVELLVVILIIGTLAAIALPAFLGQRKKGEDAAAKSDARNMVSQMDACYTAADQYTGCPEDDSGMDLGPGPGQVEAAASGEAYVVVAHSRTGNSFTARKLADGTIERTCDGSAAPEAGCQGGSW